MDEDVFCGTGSGLIKDTIAWAVLDAEGVSEPLPSGADCETWGAVGAVNVKPVLLFEGPKPAKLPNLGAVCGSRP